MNIDALKSAWQTEVASQPNPNDLDRLAHDALARTRHYERAARLRVICGSAAFLLTLAMLTVLMLLPQVWPGMRLALGLWAASMIACSIGLWRIRAENRNNIDASLAQHLHACLQHIQREIAYQRSLRWWFWLPFGVGLLSALLWQPPMVSGNRWIVLLVMTLGWAWGFVHGPRHWPERLQPQARQLQDMLAETTSSTSASGSVA